MTSRDEILSSLRNEFVENTRERLAEMSGLLEQLMSSSPDLTLLDDLRRHFHSLAGLGGTYGYPAVTTLGFEAEELCELGLPSPATLEHLRAIVTKLTREIEIHADSE